MFFMVLVTLVGLGLGMYQLFHLQKELAELREVSLACGLLCPGLTGCRMPLLQWEVEATMVHRTTAWLAEIF
jgi:hypothetical protein